MPMMFFVPAANINGLIIKGETHAEIPMIHLELESLCIIVIQ